MSASAQSGPDQYPPSDPGRTPSPAPDPPQPETDEDDFTLYDYSTPAYRIRFSAIRAAESEILLRGEEAYESGEDMTGTAFCGCSTCEARLTAAFWISWTIDAISSGDLVTVPSAPAEPSSTG